MAGRMMAGMVRRTPPPLLKLELEETARVLRKKEEMVEMESLLREEAETTSAGTAVRLVLDVE